MASLHPFVALWPMGNARSTPAHFLFGEAADPDAPSARRLLESDRRQTDRSRFVSHMRAAALFAAWRREGLFQEGKEPALFAWQRDGVVEAVAGLADLHDLPTTRQDPAEVRDTKARLEALGVVPALPVFATAALPMLGLEHLYHTPKGSLCRIIDADTLDVDAVHDPVFGREIVGALRLIFAEYAEHPVRIPVWMRSDTNSELLPPNGALLWPWVEHLSRSAR